jgi:hypothetical protein
MNSIDKIYQEMATDQDGSDRQAEIIEGIYERATDEQKVIIDNLFIALCGWSLKMLIGK